MDFKVGDIVVGHPDYKSEYRITSAKRNFVGEVVKAEPSSMNMTVKVISTNFGYEGTTHAVRKRHFLHHENSLHAIQQESKVF